ncbi:MAG: BON domain-containing protein [Parachlamydiaceae bacterium]|nr:BON domain-containing protein [Parachlamydiaceae bacterium]
MKKELFLLSTMCLALTACDNTPRTPTDNRNSNRNTTSNPSDNTSYSSEYNADNTGRNVRDRNDTMTPENQSENDVDRKITQKIRQDLMNDDSLSTNAKNIKIITSNGVVTLRGPVNSDRERNVIGQKVKSVRGIRNVDNQLEIVVISR